MALFQRRPQAGETIQYFTLGQNKTILVVGLGNMGKEYDDTRHNIGFAAVDRFANDHDATPWIEKKDLKCLLATTQLGETRVIIIKPTTFMNLSGEAVQAVSHFYKIPSDNVIAVYDELDIPFGQIRTRIGGSAAGHNGVKSVSQHIGESYGRIRIGIGPKTHEKMDSADFVLAHFTPDQQVQLKHLTKEVSAILSECIFSGAALPHETRSFIV